MDTAVVLDGIKGVGSLCAINKYGELTSVGDGCLSDIDNYDGVNYNLFNMNEVNYNE